jgi:hypothetical protein
MDCRADVRLADVSEAAGENYEYWPGTTENWIYLAMIRLMVN